MLCLHSLQDLFGLFLVDEDELVEIGFVTVDVGLGDVKPPAVDAKLLFLEPFANEWIAFDVLHLLEDVHLGNLVDFAELAVEG